MLFVLLPPPHPLHPKGCYLPASFSPGDVWLKGALGPLKSALVNSSRWGFSWAVSVLLSIKMNCQYVLCPDNHLVETQKSCKIETR